GLVRILILSVHVGAGTDAGGQEAGTQGERQSFHGCGHIASPSSRLDPVPMDRAWTKGEKTVTKAPRVLVVEDEPNIRELVCLHLGLEGYACEGVGDGQQALQRTESDRFDLLVLDVMLPGLDGVSLCRAVRNGRANRDVPILMLTARSDETDKVVGLESG